MDDYTLSMADAINEHQGNADADHSVNVSMAEAINEYQDRFSADTEGVTEHQATIPADTNHSPGAKIVFASADEPWLDEMAHPFSSADAIATPSHRAADANICPTLSHVPQVGHGTKWDKTPCDVTSMQPRPTSASTRLYGLHQGIYGG